jgi:ribonuclease BN (tRNA processing enzyme)
MWARPLAAGAVELTLLGTCGEFEKRTRRHSALLLRHGEARIMIDCGADWRGRVAWLAPSAIVLIHGHPDHAFGLADGISCPVYATAATWQLIDRYPIADRRVVSVGEPLSIEGIRFEAVAVEHSTRAPAVGYRITAGSVSIFYVPDVVAIPQRRRALSGIDLYVGDGATIATAKKRQTYWAHDDPCPTRVVRGGRGRQRDLYPLRQRDRRRWRAARRRAGASICPRAPCDRPHRP